MYPPVYSRIICVYLNHLTDVKTIPLMIDHMKVPALETTYMCQYVEFPNDTTYDVIASEAIIDNTAIAHHIVVYGCDQTGIWFIHYSILHIKTIKCVEFNITILTETNR